MKPKYLISLETSIRGLFAEKEDTIFQRQEAFLRFICYLRHPHNPKAADFAFEIYDCLYKAHHANRSPGTTKTKEAAKQLIEGKIIDLLSNIFGGDFLEINITDWKENGSLDLFAADIVKFLLTSQPTPPNSSRGVSIKKAHYFFQKCDEYEREWDYSWKNFNNMWVKYKSIAHFMYVNVYEFNNMLYVFPSDPLFAEKIDNILADTDRLKAYFEKSFYVFNELAERLDRRATETIKFPKLPRGFVPVPVFTPALSQEAIDTMARYKSTHNL
ncbi:MAG: hypothetical protein WC807_21460 [Hyphomicrobium sp.]|jgi:hypothetical protein